MKEKYIHRSIEDKFEKRLEPNKVLILLGARRVGKTELIRHFLEKQTPEEYLLLNGEDQYAIDLLEHRSIKNYARLLVDKKILIVDEAQKIPSIGLKLKLIVDHVPNIKVVATGSSVFDLSNKLGEPLVGRSNVINIYPFAQMEFSKIENYIDTFGNLEERMIFGSYPELVNYPKWEDKIDYLEGVVNAYLLKDILEFDGIKKADKIIDLLRLIALQIGKDVSVDELARSLKGISRNTVEMYLDLLAKVFIIYKLPGFSRNLRKEITKSNRWYFYDNGIRNALIRNFNPFNFRNDVGDLWENYLMAERLKRNSYLDYRVNSFFWRTYDQQEIDLIEENSTKLSAFEFKWNSKRKIRIPSAWKKNYPKASFEFVNPDNYLEFISG